jgi:endonuclease YncB( thermonuclease family)
LKKSRAASLLGPALLLFFFSSHSTLAESSGLPEVQTYEQLVRAIRDIQQATHPENKREKVLEAWTIGKLIELHAAEYRLWKDYPAYLFERLSGDLKIGYSTLRHMRNFARFYPDEAPKQDLDWWHYQAIMYLPDPAQREAIAVRDEKEKWTSDKLQAELKKLRPKHQPPPKAPASPSLVEKLNHYRATVTSVVDGDTFEADVDLGFGLTAFQVFRLRGLDAPEMGTEEGIAAKSFLVLQLKKTKGDVILKVSGRDQYGRYLVDVWLYETDDPKGVPLNQKLIDEGLAVTSRD